MIAALWSAISDRSGTVLVWAAVIALVLVGLTALREMP